jgi:hypothetical protein
MTKGSKTMCHSDMVLVGTIVRCCGAPEYIVGWYFSACPTYLLKIDTAM